MDKFNAFRQGDGPTLYVENHTPVTVDKLEVGLITCTCVIVFAYLVVLPGIRGTKRVYGALRTLLTIYIGATILLVNFGQEWEVANITTKVEYKAAMSEDIVAEIGVKIGLRSVNITLKGTPEHQLGERINYNERYSWAPFWGQGRNFYGPFAGQINQEFRESQYRGLPYPILWIAEYFTLDGENIRWGRSYRMSGLYTHILLWSAFPTWVIANILLFMMIRYAAYCMVLTGFWLIWGNILFTILRWGPILSIPFADDVLHFRYGWCYWMTLSTGILCMLYGVVLYICNRTWPVKTSKFFQDHDIPVQQQRRRGQNSDENLPDYDNDRVIVIQTLNRQDEIQDASSSQFSSGSSSGSEITDTGRVIPSHRSINVSAVMSPNLSLEDV
ncbi:dual oxidase maturation factor 1-like [Saccoglossus kowalevskii]|uniref:Dual oxidase maturation factor 1-like n=1 Tax=Saccoglossus kowalevskii TaxID=10224 RepID=A0ABM0MEZ0_SACKO|nr:PREDICTED: dual oxidase maturation factor 1-like [Saccoglossus kowalevskii]